MRTHLFARNVMLLVQLVASATSVAGESPTTAPSGDAQWLQTHGFLLFHDSFDRVEDGNGAKAIGQGWESATADRVPQIKQAKIEDGILKVSSASKEAGHAAHIHHDAGFADGGVMVRFRFPGLHNDESLTVGFVDRNLKEVHAGHLCYAHLYKSSIKLIDNKTGISDQAIRKRRQVFLDQKAPLPPDLDALLKTKELTMPWKADTEWHDLILVTQGDEMRLTIDNQLIAKHCSPGFAHPSKRWFSFGIPSTVWIKDVKIWKEPTVDYDFNAMIQPTPATASFQDPDHYVWCGTMIRADDGKYHLFYSRWQKKFGFLAWVTHSEVAHAVADSPLGPFKPKDVALPERGPSFWDGHCTHNPTVMRFGDKFYLYYMGNYGDRAETKGLNWIHRNHQRVGVAVADSPDGPWQRFDKPIIEPTPGFYDALCCSNPSVAARPNGGYVMVYKAVGDKTPGPFGGPVLHCVATSASPTGPFVKQRNPVFVKEGVHFAAEDPFIWADGGIFWAIVKDNAGYFTGAGKSTALWQSADGLAWRLAPHPLVATTEIAWADGHKQRVKGLERPQLYFENGRPRVLLFAASPDPNGEGAFNVRIPLSPSP